MQRLILFALLFISKSSFSQDTSLVYFDFDKYELNNESRHVLDNLSARPNLLSAIIYGHTDQFGSNAYNDKLSVKRANAVKDYFTAKGIDAGKISIVKGFGENMPAINQLDETSRQANRRVVIITYYQPPKKDTAAIIVPKKETPKIEPPKVENNPPQKTIPTRKPIKESLIQEVTDTTTREGDNIILDNMNFYGGRHVLLPESYPSLQELLYVMQTIPTLEIEIQGHICCQEGESDGQDIDTGEPFLSFNRAKAIYDYLVSKGIDRKRMRYKGYGHKFPIIAVERTEAERTTNRRVEIKIIKK